MATAAKKSSVEQTMERLSRLIAEQQSKLAADQAQPVLKVSNETRNKKQLKRNPTLNYLLCVQKGKGPVMTWNGERFTNNPPFKVFSRSDTASDKGKALLKQFTMLHDYRMWIMPKFQAAGAAKDSRKHRAMRGGSKMNPSPRVNAELDQAAKKLEDFTGHPVAHLESAYSRSSQKTGLIVGELDLIGYRAKRDGKTERYGHHFKKNSRPLLAVTSDGKQLHIVGGQYEFTEAGIEDR